MRRRFVQLTPLEALQAAIAIERRNAEIYRNLAATFASYDADVGQAFGAMAEEESQHRLELEAYLRERFPAARPTAADDAGIEEAVEAPDLEEPEAFIFDDVTVEQAVGMAEQAEARAVEFYSAMANEAADGGLRKLCRHMAEVESAHRLALQRLRRS